MQSTRLANAEAALKQLTRGELESLALAYVHSHAVACELVGEEKPDHADSREVERRIEQYESDSLIGMLAPLAALAEVLGSGSA